MRIALGCLGLIVTVTTCLAEGPAPTLESLYDKRFSTANTLVKELAEIYRIAPKDSAFPGEHAPGFQAAYSPKTVPTALVIFRNPLANWKGKGIVDLLLIGCSEPKGGLKVDADLSRLFDTPVIRVKDVVLDQLVTNDFLPNQMPVISSIFGSSLHPKVVKGYEALMGPGYLPASHPIRQTLGSRNAVLVAPYPGPGQVPGVKNDLTSSFTEVFMIENYLNLVENETIARGEEYYGEPNPAQVGALKEIRNSQRAKDLFVAYGHTVFQLARKSLSDPTESIEAEVKMLKAVIAALKKESPSLLEALSVTEHEDGASGFVSRWTLHRLNPIDLGEMVEREEGSDVHLTFRTGMLGHFINRLRPKPITWTGNAAEIKTGIWEYLMRDEKSVEPASAGELKHYLQDLPIVTRLHADDEIKRFDDRIKSDTKDEE